MNYFTPHYINAHQSDLRAIKDGWYAMDEDGNLVSGPFSSKDQCVFGGNVGFGSMLLKKASRGER